MLSALAVGLADQRTSGFYCITPSVSIDLYEEEAFNSGVNDMEAFDGKVFILEGGHEEVRVRDVNGAALYKFTIYEEMGEVTSPSDLAVGNDRVYVVDGDTIRFYTLDGQFEGYYGLGAEPEGPETAGMRHIQMAPNRILSIQRYQQIDHLSALGALLGTWDLGTRQRPWMSTASGSMPWTTIRTKFTRSITAEPCFGPPEAMAKARGN